LQLVASEKWGDLYPGPSLGGGNILSWGENMSGRLLQPKTKKKNEGGLNYLRKASIFKRRKEWSMTGEGGERVSVGILHVLSGKLARKGECAKKRAVSVKEGGEN